MFQHLFGASAARHKILLGSNLILVWQTACACETARNLSIVLPLPTTSSYQLLSFFVHRVCPPFSRYIQITPLLFGTGTKLKKHRGWAHIHNTEYTYMCTNRRSANSMAKINVRALHHHLDLPERPGFLRLSHISWYTECHYMSVHDTPKPSRRGEGGNLFKQKKTSRHIYSTLPGIYRSLYRKYRK